MEFYNVFRVLLLVVAVLSLVTAGGGKGINAVAGTLIYITSVVVLMLMR